jgi:hypothetical protein
MIINIEEQLEIQSSANALLQRQEGRMVREMMRSLMTMQQVMLRIMVSNTGQKGSIFSTDSCKAYNKACNNMQYSHTIIQYRHDDHYDVPTKTTRILRNGTVAEKDKHIVQPPDGPASPLMKVFVFTMACS